MKSISLIFIMGMMSITIGCQQKPHEQSVAPVHLQDGISTGTLEDVGIQTDVIAGIVDDVAAGFYPNRHSLLIYKDDKLVLEKYFTGQDYNWGKDIGIVRYADTVLHDMRSVSKSFVSACIGIAIDQGLIKNIDQPIFDFFEDYKQYNNEGREKLTIKHLLTMSSGLEWNEDVPYDNPENSEIQMDKSGDGVGYVLSRKLTSEPGTVWQYNGGTTEVLAAIIKRVSGKNVYAFAKENVFEPMGISKSEWTNSTGTQNPAAASGLRLTSRDMLKFGILYMQEGQWGTRQIVSKEWVTQSLASSISRPEGGGYGYQFWVFDYEVQGKKLTIPAAVGNGDQRIFMDRPNKLIVVTTAGNYDQVDIENNASALLKNIYTSFSPK